MRLIVIGAGAVGGWLAGALTRGGAEVGLVARGATLEALRSGGLTLIEGERRETFRLAASEQAADLPRADAVILAAKTYAFADVTAAAAPAFGHGPMLVTAMNGLPWWFLDDFGGALANGRLESVDPGGRAAAMLTHVRPVAAVVHVSSRAEAPGVIRVAGVDRSHPGRARRQDLARNRRAGAHSRSGRGFGAGHGRHSPGDLGQAVGQHEHEPSERADRAHGEADPGRPAALRARARA